MVNINLERLQWAALSLAVGLACLIAAWLLAALRRRRNKRHAQRRAFLAMLLDQARQGRDVDKPPMNDG